MRNIEIKASLRDTDYAENTAKILTGGDAGFILNQVDTYFAVDSGRMKLREINNKDAQLIFYNRVDNRGPKKCVYHIVDIDNPDEMKDMLGKALGIDVVVKKNRKVYLYENVRIHIDRVEELGEFIEFEAVLEDDMTDTEGRNSVQRLMSEFGINKEDLIEDSYADIIRRK
ncbi:MAG TPA: class IV adenylate cyclase [bacterium]|nr:class IV adenylate cyclase [bacterium]